MPSKLWVARSSRAGITKRIRELQQFNSFFILSFAHNLHTGLYDTILYLYKWIQIVTSFAG
jgi:hypothetical protein